MKQYLLKLLGKHKPPMVIICGPTASGKTGLSIRVAQDLKNKGIKSEILSADSRQVYEGIPVFSGAVTVDEMQGIPHHLVGTEDISKPLSVSWFKESALAIIQNMQSRAVIPIVVGGSAFWIQSLLFQDDYPHVEPNHELRVELEALATKELAKRLRSLDSRRASEIDTDNPRRLIRAIEIATTLGYVPRMKYTTQNTHNIIVVYVNPGRDTSNQKIVQNVANRIEQGLLDEARIVSTQITPERMIELGLGYKYIANVLDETINLEEFIEKMTQEEQRYAKKQRTFFKKITSHWTGNIRLVTDTKDRGVVSEITAWVQKSI